MMTDVFNLERNAGRVGDTKIEEQIIGFLQSTRVKRHSCLHKSPNQSIARPLARRPDRLISSEAKVNGAGGVAVSGRLARVYSSISPSFVWAIRFRSLAS